MAKRGRKPLDKSIIRSNCVMVRVSEEDLKTIKKEAENDGLSMSSELLHGWKCYVEALRAEGET